MHKDGVQSSARDEDEVERDPFGQQLRTSLEVRIKGTELSFYANGQFLTRIN